MQKNNTLETVLLWLTRAGLWALLFTPLIVASGFFFPYVTGKNFFFRIIVEVTAGVWLALAVLRPAFRPRRGPIIWAFVAFAIAITLSTIFGADPYHSFWSNFERMEGLITYLHLFVLFLISTAVLRSEKDWKALFHISVGVSIIVSLIGLLEKFGVVDLGGSVGGSAAGAARIFSTLGNPIYLAIYLLFHFFILGFLICRAQRTEKYLLATLSISGGLPVVFMIILMPIIRLLKQLPPEPIVITRHLALYFLVHVILFVVLLIWRNSKISKHIVYGSILIFGFYIFIAAGTRGAIMGLAAGGIAGLIALIFMSRVRLIRFGAVGALVGIVLAGVGLWSVRESSFVKSRPLLNRLADVNTQSSTVQSRFMIWNIALEGFRERPILGWGPDNFIIPYAKYYNPHLFGNEPWFDRVHNMHLEWLVAGGIVGFLAYIALFVTAFLVIWQLWRRAVFDAISAAFLVGVFVAYLTQNFFVFDTVITYLFITLFLAFLHSMVTGVPVPPAQHQASVPVANSSRMAIAAVLVVAAIAFAVVINRMPMRMAKGIIETLNTARPGKTVIDITNAYDATAKLGTFGISELRERIAELAIQSSGRADAAGSPDIVLLLAKSIEEMRKEVEGRPQSVKSMITLGKLLQLRFSSTRDHKDRDESIAVYNRAIEQAPFYPGTAIGLAETYLTMRDGASAVQAMARVYEHVERPNPLFYTVLLVDVIAGDFDGAIAHVQKFRDYSSLPEYKDGGSWVGVEEAEDTARRALVSQDAAGRKRFLLVLRDAVHPSYVDDPILLLALAETEAQLGKKDDARAYAMKALETGPEYKAQIDEFLTNLTAS